VNSPNPLESLRLIYPLPDKQAKYFFCFIYMYPLREIKMNTFRNCYPFKLENAQQSPLQPILLTMCGP
jgi:hypothetical protein